MTQTPTITEKYAAAVDQIKSLESEVGTLKANSSNFDQVKAGLEAKVSELTGQVSTLDKEITTLKQANEALQTSVTEKDASISALNTEVGALKGKLAMSPAHIQVGGTDPVPGQQAGGGEGGGTSYAEQYAAIQDPAAQTAFYREHKAKIINNK